jgi:lysophospholipase L1-like esterase
MLPAFDQIARVPLAPVLAAQALAVRRRAQLLPEPPGPRSGTTGSGPDLRVLIVGDSSAAGVGAATQDQALGGQLIACLAKSHRVSWQLQARTGNTTRDTLAALGALPPGRFDVAVTALGVNDVTRGVSARQFHARQSRLLNLLQTRFGAGRIVVTGVPPMHRFPLLPNPLRWVLGAQAARLDKTLVALVAARPGIAHVALDFPNDRRFAAIDGFHPSPVAYTMWAHRLAERITSEPAAH